jgi:hypothetical protein
MILAWGGGVLSSASSTTWTQASTRHSWHSSHRSCAMNKFSKHSAIALAFSGGRNIRPEGPWITAGAFGPSLFKKNFAVGQIARGVTSQLVILFSHYSSAFLRVVLRTVLMTQLTAALHAVFLVSYHNFLSLCFSCRRLIPAARCLVPRGWFCVSTACKPRLWKLRNYKLLFQFRLLY